MQRVRTGVATVLAAGTLGVAAAGAAVPSGGGEPVAVVVQSDGRVDAARAAVRRAGGTVTLDLPIVHGFAARVPERAVAALQRADGVRAVTANRPVRVTATTANDGTNLSTVNSVYYREVNADKLWSRGVDGRTVRVALVDTGVANVPDLAGRIVPVKDVETGTTDVLCADFSGEQSCEDSYGHGTFVAGVIAGNGASSGGTYKGVAPGADIVSVKLAGRDGSADVTKLLAAIQWVVSFRETYNIRVLNLSLGTDSPVSYKIDPLNFAVERAWAAGLVVVVSAGNRGPAQGTISKPADDPFVVTVGAVDDRETPAIDDDRLPDFSSRGPTVTDKLAKPDVVAPGGKVVSLRSPGSFIEEVAGPGQLAGTAYRRGSGTSFASAVTSGVAALVLQARPAWSPDRVKFALTATARKVAERDRNGVGSGLVDALAAIDAPAGVANGDITTLSDGTGSLDGSRGSVRVTGPSCGLVDPLLDPECMTVHGEQTARGTVYDAEEYRDSDWTGSSWYDSQWTNGSSWYGSSWYGSSWYGVSWQGSSWYGNKDNTLYGVPIVGSAWYGAWQ